MSRVARYSAAAFACSSPRGDNVKAIQPPVQDVVGIPHLAVSEQVDDSHRLPFADPLSHAGGPASAAALAAAGSAVAMRSIAASSCAADKNHASNALGGRYTPASSMV